MATTVFGVEMVALTCCRHGCGIVFAVPAWWEQKRREDHAEFHCPNGHGQFFAGESEAERLRREKASLTARLDQTTAARDDWMRRADRAGAEKRRLLARVRGGVCPDCHRSFSNLRRHVGMKHPGVVVATPRRLPR